MKNLKLNYLNTIRSEINTLTPEKLDTLFTLIHYLNVSYLYFMTEESHIQFVQFYYKFPTIRKPDILRSYLFQSIRDFVIETRYPTILKAIDLINENYTFENIINILTP